MRTEFVNSIKKIAVADSKIIFLTNDLGYNAFENLKELMGERFMNAGVAEQNMISVAAGMAYKGYKVFCYSIAPFIVYRGLEQFRNDVCFHNLPVFLVGNGGGYGYGIMGAAHHALNDIACMSSMPNAKCWVPAFNNEVEQVVLNILNENKPAYLRLCNSINSPDGYMLKQSMNRIVKSEIPKVTILSSGGMATQVLKALSQQELAKHCDLFSVACFPFELSEECKASIVQTKKLITIEEHCEVGGLAQSVSLQLHQHKIQVNDFVSFTAKEYPNNLYGNREYHIQASQMSEEDITLAINKML